VIGPSHRSLHARDRRRPCARWVEAAAQIRHSTDWSDHMSTRAVDPRRDRSALAGEHASGRRQPRQSNRRSMDRSCRAFTRVLGLLKRRNCIRRPPGGLFSSLGGSHLSVGDRNLTDLHSQVHREAYRALPSRRQYIPKADGQKRPIAIVRQVVQSPRRSARTVVPPGRAAPTGEIWRLMSAAAPEARVALCSPAIDLLCAGPRGFATPGKTR